MKVEVKNWSNEVVGTIDLPDAVTERGRRHLLELRRARQEGRRAAVVFVIQREDAVAFAPHDESDPRFGEVVREAATDGVEVYAHRCRVTSREIALDGRIPVVLSGSVDKAHPRGTVG